MLTTEERRLEFVVLVQKMRTAQKDNCGTVDDVVDVQYHERQVDRALKMLRQRELYDA